MGPQLHRADAKLVADAAGLSRREILALAALGLAAGAPRAFAAAPQGQLTWGAHISLAPTWFDPAETSGIITPFMVLYALHDALVKPMPGQLLAASLAESWSASEDALSYEFVLRKGATFHNGEKSARRFHHPRLRNGNNPHIRRAPRNPSSMRRLRSTAALQQKPQPGSPLR